MVAAIDIRDGELARARAAAIVEHGTRGVLTAIELFDELERRYTPRQQESAT